MTKRTIKFACAGCGRAFYATATAQTVPNVCPACNRATYDCLRQWVDTYDPELLEGFDAWRQRESGQPTSDLKP